MLIRENVSIDNVLHTEDEFEEGKVKVSGWIICCILFFNEFI